MSGPRFKPAGVPRRTDAAEACWRKDPSLSRKEICARFGLGESAVGEVARKLRAEGIDVAPKILLSGRYKQRKR